PRADRHRYQWHHLQRLDQQPGAGEYAADRPALGAPGWLRPARGAGPVTPGDRQEFLAATQPAVWPSSGDRPLRSGAGPFAASARRRSEEHTSELQSRENL